MSKKDTKQAFGKFTQTNKGAKLKEQIRQEKRKIKKETEAFHEEKRALKKAERSAQRGGAPLSAPTRSSDRPASRSTDRPASRPTDRPASRPTDRPASRPTDRPASRPTDRPVELPLKSKTLGKSSESKKAEDNEPLTGMPLNKYIAHSGLCSRRDAAELVKQGKVHVNGSIATQPGMRIEQEDVVKVNGKRVQPSRHFVYILLNKPKDYITTSEDPQGRKTVLDLVKSATTERVYPVGRLDRNTSGVLLLTNDGDLAQTLAHPKFEVKKIYHVGLDKPLTKADFEKIVQGLMLEDGLALVDALAFADPKDKTQVGIEIHSGKNRIVRRIFEHLGYQVKTLDRVMYAGLTKKNVQRGTWRFLTDKELRLLKFFNNAKKKKQEGK
jgi:23S rRNA pseudouridine2605 synthase